MADAYRKGKLNKKAEKLCFVGYSLQTKGCRLFDENTSKVVVCRDVIFDESVFQHDSTTVEVNEGSGVNGCEKDDDISVVPEEEEEPVEQPE